MNWLLSLTTVAAIAAPTAVLSLYYVQTKRSMPSFWAMFAYFAHLALFWIVVLMINVFGAYPGPTETISTWKAIIDLQAMFTLVAFAAIEWKIGKDRNRLQHGLEQNE